MKKLLTILIVLVVCMAASADYMLMCTRPVYKDREFNWAVTIKDVNDDLWAADANLPDGATFVQTDPNSWHISWTPPEAGTFPLYFDMWEVIVRDANIVPGHRQLRVDLKVIDPNPKAIITIGDCIAD